MEWLIAIALGAATAAGPAAQGVDGERAVVAETDRMNARQFDERSRMARTHPNELWRLYGSDAAARGDWGDAMRHFRHAARHADKYSQHRISLMYWHGVGVERDPALAYAWADLAAERMYPNFVFLREKMWQELSEPERERALREGQALYDEFGDTVAKPRFERAVAQGRRDITGSHLGFVGWLKATGPRGGVLEINDHDAIDMTPMFASWRWNTDKYWAVEDAIWRHGNVEVGPVRTDND